MDMIKLGCGYTKDAIKFILCLFAPSNIKNTFNALRSMTPRDIIVGFFRLHFHLAYMLLMFLFTIFWSVAHVSLVIFNSPISADSKQHEETKNTAATLKRK